MSGLATWLQQGVDAGYCGPAVCATHDGLPTTADEDEDFDDGHDPCIFVIRAYECDEIKRAVEENHPPSEWRQ